MVIDFNELFANISKLKVAVIGDVMLDTYWWGNVERISPEASSQFSTKAPCIARTASPCTRTIVSRHLGSPLIANRHQSAYPAPPTKAMEPSIMVISRCVRLLNRLKVYHRIGWYHSTHAPASRSGASSRFQVVKLPM